MTFDVCVLLLAQNGIALIFDVLSQVRVGRDVFFCEVIFDIVAKCESSFCEVVEFDWVCVVAERFGLVSVFWFIFIFLLFDGCYILSN